MPRKNLSCCALGAALFAAMVAPRSNVRASVIFSDNFNRTNSSTVGNSWTESNPGGGNVQISGNLLDVESTQGNNSGNSYVTQATSSFPAPWSNVLSSGSSGLIWTANMRSDNSDMGGFDSSQEGIAFVLAATSSNLNTANGYAIVWGQSGSTDPIRLVSFTGGLVANANLTNIITATGASGTPGDPNSNYMSVEVTYDPSTNTWALFARNDGTSSFTDPLTGTLTFYGTAVNSTYTGSTMTSVGLLGRYDGNNDNRVFDNVTIQTPEPAAMGLLGFATLGMLARRPRA